MLALCRRLSSLSVTPAARTLTAPQLCAPIQAPARTITATARTQNWTKPRVAKPQNLWIAKKMAAEAAERWLPSHNGNLKRMRSGNKNKMAAKSSRRQSRLNRPVFATRTQLRKLKKILPHGFVGPRR
jgi:hypothetical protein